MYVVDILITRSFIVDIGSIKSSLYSVFSMTDSCKVKFPMAMV